MIWDKVEREGIIRFPIPCYGRIPNFEGSNRAANKINKLNAWREANVEVANPDYAQLLVREIALTDGKTLVIASPRLRRCYILVEPDRIKRREGFASTIRGALILGKQVEEIPRPDVIVTGCVAVDREFYHLGKGGGYGDKEILEVYRRYGEVPVITTIHDCQLVDALPREVHDMRGRIVLNP